jgi:hypothetical protein
MMLREFNDDVYDAASVIQPRRKRVAADRLVLVANGCLRRFSGGRIRLCDAEYNTAARRQRADQQHQHFHNPGRIFCGFDRWIGGQCDLIFANRRAVAGNCWTGSCG